METRHLKYFVEVAQHQSFTHAASALHIAQPALSIAIKKFEQQLGVTLFRRDERKVSLTHEGEVLLEHALRILRQLEDAQLAVDELKGLVKGEVRLGTPSMMGSYFFPEIIMAFKSYFPNLKMTMVEAGTQSIRKMLLNGELDIGVILNHDLPPDLEVDPLLSSQMVAVVGKEHELAEKKEIEFKEFFDHELVMFKPGYFHRDFIDNTCKEHKLTANISFETNLLPMILSIVKHEYAITALLELVTDHESEIRAIPFNPPVYLDLALAWRKEGYLSNADRTFIEFVKKYV
ncbi:MULTISPECIES: LysR family transcriptional regulator [Vibrio]|jgi:DNA-binding transcriptional LysR family regulator|uniref:LysR family transcriptional regulator n=2 Tax=Vibrio TaxID=662 RepID=A0A2J8GLV0_VIBDI|nr:MULTISPECIES: LysR substrate-binding domain-containing protein [Vibrio]MCF7364180.1 LysR substrate-binding domain-containing protein [Vibrio sp. A1-b2]MDW6016810.1 LysR substrate-binding domain-containing protein [Vibrio plantisponsor]NNM39819.1 LysR family transcriptional regulator [Vibrio plantisponsor]PNH78827.1 LysR family transcriptional regulator [Vibrio diazotrophicus]PNH86980.1 LysR family transcriptional regulator [Vibrio diazotrophicus]